jgi:hypothetical protein
MTHKGATHTMLLCVWIFINPVLDTVEGTSLANPVGGSLLVILLSDWDLESFHCARFWPKYNLYHL